VALAVARIGAEARRPVASLSATPARIALSVGETTGVELSNRGPAPIVVSAATSALALDLRGRPVVVARRRRLARDAARWLTVRPSRLTIAPRATAAVEVVAQPPAEAEPGDHHAVILFATHPSVTGSVAVQMRVGVRTVVHVAGPVVRDVSVRTLRVRRRGKARLLEIGITNRGNVTETLARGELRLTILARGRVVARLRTARRELLPRSRATLTAVYRGGRVGRVRVRAELRGRVRVFRVRL
jgi:hypothetical protein